MVQLVQFVIIFGILLVPAIVFAYFAFVPMHKMREAFGNLSAFRGVEVPLGFYVTVKLVSLLIALAFASACTYFVVQTY